MTKAGGTTERHSARLATVAFVRSGDRVLLLRHPVTHDRFRGLWNGIGGHVEAGENIRAAARRELREESGLEVDDLALRCVIHETGMLGHAYVVFVFVGSVPTATVHSPEGIQLAWHPLDRLAELPLVEDVAALLPRLLTAREPFFVSETYDGADGILSLHTDAGRGGEAPHV